MAKRKKYPRLPNGYGQIRYLGKNRRNPYGVYPPATEEYDSGQKKPPKALCYVSDWMVGFAVLTAYKAGTYEPGMEQGLIELTSSSDSELVNKILADYNRSRQGIEEETDSPTFSDMYEKFHDWKFNGKKKYSKSSIGSSRTAFKNCAAIHNKPIDQIGYEELQEILDSSPLKHSSLELMHSCMKQTFKFALAQGLIEKNPTELLKINIEDDDEHGVPFSNDDLKKLWENRNHDIAQILLIMCYSGYRIGELSVAHVDLKKECFTGGLKTKTSKERIVPIHSAIYTIIVRRIGKYKAIMNMSDQKFRDQMYPYLESLKMKKHTPHDCRHTFSMLCEEYSVRENDCKRMLGHKIGDITNDIYGHRDLEELRTEIEKIPAPDLL